MIAYNDKEDIYDEKISPLMSQIIGICQDNGINMVASFQLRSRHEKEDGDFLCTTSLPVVDDHFPPEYKSFGRSLLQPPPFTAFTITISGRDDK